MKTHIDVAAERTGWTVEVINWEYPYLNKYTKGDLFFYSNSFVNFSINHQSAGLSANKIYAPEILNREGVPTIDLEKITSLEDDYLISIFNKFSQNGKLSIVAKPIDSFGARGVYKCDNLAEFLEKRDEISKRPYCISTLFPHEFEIRFVVFKGKAEFFHLKPDNPSNFIRPAKQNFSLKPSKLRELIKKAEKAAFALKFDFVAVDFLVNEDDDILIETNLNPNIFTYTKTSTLHFERAIRLYVKMFQAKERLLKEF